MTADALLPDDADLLRELDPAHRARVHDHRGRHRRAPSPAARGRHVLPHGHGRERLEERRASAEEAGVDPKEFVDRLVEEHWRPLPGASRRRPTSSSGRPMRATTASSRSSSSGSTTTATSTRAPTRACTASRARPSTPRPTLPTACAPTHGTPLEWIEEKNYFFKLSAYQERLLEHLRRAARLRAPRVPRQRGEALHRGRASRTSASAARASPGAFPSRGTRARSSTSGSTR